MSKAVWPLGGEWPAGALLPSCLTVELSVLEVETLIWHHDDFAATAHAEHDHNVGTFHQARASYLRQRLAAVVPHRLTPDRKGHA